MEPDCEVCLVRLYWCREDPCFDAANGARLAKQPPMLFVLDRHKPVSLQAQLSLNLKRLVHAGTLRPGKAVPSSRELARELQISRNTVLQAYDRLVGEGYLEPSARRGLFVSELLEQRTLRNTGPVPVDVSSPASPAPTSFDSAEAPRPFQPCRPDVRLFPLQLWNRARSRALRTHGPNLLQYHSNQPLGLPALRRALANYLHASRGVRCDWRQIAVTNGSQQALFLLAQLLLRAGDRAALEDPGYLGARLALQETGAVIHPIRVDADGMNRSGEKDFLPTLIYTTPSRQFPTGACLSLSRRLELVELAGKKKIWIIEDDYDSEFRYSQAPLPSLQSLDASQRVIYLGSTSKALFPSLRIGYAVLPPTVVEEFARVRAVADEHGPWIDQATLAEFIESGAFYSHIRRCRREYAMRLEVFLESAVRFGLPLEFPHTDGGMNLAGFLRTRKDDAECSHQLRNNGLDVPPLSRYSLRTTAPGLLFGFTAFQPSAIRKSVHLAARVLRGQ
jgi:GntR family transcriptional regulator/MocR family aminotransferase